MQVRQKVELMQDAHLGGHSNIFLFILNKNFLYKILFLHMQFACSLVLE
jgi:hypothetical protein